MFKLQLDVMDPPLDVPIMEIKFIRWFISGTLRITNNGKAVAFVDLAVNGLVVIQRSRI